VEILFPSVGTVFSKERVLQQPRLITTTGQKSRNDHISRLFNFELRELVFLYFLFASEHETTLRQGLSQTFWCIAIDGKFD
jgi:hypothetical protein